MFGTSTASRGFLKDSLKLQDEFWHAPSGETLNNHVFYVTADDPKSMFIQVNCGDFTVDIIDVVMSLLVVDIAIVLFVASEIWLLLILSLHWLE